MKKSISYWAFPGGGSGEKPIRDCLREAKAAGFEAVELAVSGQGELCLETSSSEASQIASWARQEGIEIASLATGLFWQHLLTSDDPAEREQAKGVAVKTLELAAALGTDAILLIPGAVDVFFDPSKQVVPYQPAWERASQGVGELLPAAEKHGVAICVENVWNRFLLSPRELRSFITQFNHRFIGCYFDVGNVMLTGYPEQWIEILGGLIHRVHLKDFRRSVGTADGFVDLLEGDVDWPAVMNALRRVGYDGYLTAELFPYRHHPETLLGRTSIAMDAIMGRSGR